MYRHLTLMGRVLILNSLVSSLFYYRIQLIHSIKEETYVKIEKCFENFLWSGKKPKLPLKIVTLPKHEGGLGLTNIRLRHEVLILKWVQVLQKKDLMYELARHFTGIDNLDLMIKANLNEADCNTHLQYDNFWTRLLKQWCKYKYHEPQSSEGVEKQQIWFNSMIKVNNKIIYYHKAYQAGIQYLTDLRDQNEWKSWDSIVQTFGNCITWLQLNSIISAVPDYWKFVLPRKKLIDKHISMKTLLVDKKCSNVLYKRVNTSTEAIVKCAKIWNQFLGEEYDQDLPKAAFRNLYSLTKIVKLRNFQYRLLHNKIFCNNVLFYWHKTTSQECDFCEEAKQDVTHLLYKCSAAQKIWHDLLEKLNELNLECNLALNLRNLIFNQVHPQARSVMNLLILMVKIFIFRC